MTNEANGEWLNGLDCKSAGLTRKRERRGDMMSLDLDDEFTTTKTDEEIRAEFDAAAARQKPMRTSHNEDNATVLSYSSAGAIRRR